MNPAVSRRKFEREVEAVRQYVAGRRKGYEWELIHAVYPRAVLDMPTASTTYRLRIYANSWDAEPASYRFIDPTDPKYNRILPAAAWPRGGTPFLLDHMTPREPKPVPNRPFICLPGTREYHAHKSHQNAPWDARRGDPEYSFTAMLVAIQTRLNERCGAA